MANLAVGRTRRVWGPTPEIYFTKPIDNSRLVKVSDPVRRREMASFVAALAVLFVVLMSFCWQHYSAIEYGYRNEALRAQRDQLRQSRAQLQLEEASLRELGRIDVLAQQMGLQAPQPGQVVSLSVPESGDTAPILARVAAVSVISAPR
jgi:cell division protein FtsL